MLHSVSFFSTSRHDTGFTLLELIVALAIGAILVTMAVPSFTTTIQNNRLTAQTNDFVSTLNLARSEAIKRGTRITVCKSADASSCDTGTTGWEQGWIVFVDSDADQVRDAGETILQTYASLDSGNTLIGDSTTNVKNYVSYRASGKTTFPTNGGEVELILCDERNDTSVAKGISISPTGRVSTIPGSSSTLSCSS
jgi:type IV fimbrial biogenesis protein FimT